MKVFVTEDEMLALAWDYLDAHYTSDHSPEVAAKLDMVFCEEMGMYEDTENYMLRKLKLIYHSK